MPDWNPLPYKRISTIFPFPLDLRKSCYSCPIFLPQMYILCISSWWCSFQWWVEIHRLYRASLARIDLSYCLVKLARHQVWELSVTQDVGSSSSFFFSILSDGGTFVAHLPFKWTYVDYTLICGICSIFIYFIFIIYIMCYCASCLNIFQLNFFYS